MLCRHSKKTSKCMLVLLFCIVLGGILIANSKFLLGILQTETSSIFSRNGQQELLSPTEIETSFNEAFYGRLNFINLNGLAARILGQKLLNGTVKSKNGQLDLAENYDYEFNFIDETEKVEKAIAILDYARKTGANILYAQRPWKNSDPKKSQLPYGMESDYGAQFDFWCDEMSSQDIPILDLRISLKGHLMFYDTDHHWTVESSFYGAKSIVEKLNQEYGLGLEAKRWLDINQYERKNYQDSFLGSQGIRTGKYYAGKDDFEVLWPNFATDFEYARYENHNISWKKQGTFNEVFISRKLLEDPEYNNKYSAYMYDGFIENRIINHHADNNLKVLLISDSFSRPMATFFSLCFLETRYLDPQEGRYTDSYTAYIKEYKPDVVVMMFPGDGTFQNV